MTIKKTIIVIILSSIGSFIFGWLSSNIQNSKPTSGTNNQIELPQSNETVGTNSLIYEFHLQLGAFKVPYFASQLAHKVKKRGYTVILRNETIKGESFNLVEVGPFNKYSQALKHKKFLEKDNPSLGKISIKKRIKD